MSHDPSIVISVIIPFYNEEESLPELHRRLTEVLTGMAGDYELIYIDDGSTDGSNAEVKKLRAAGSHVRLITFRRNQGKSVALAVGFRAARGRFLVTIDADLQDEPKEIPRLFAKMEEGYDLVSGWKKVRHDPLTKTIPSRLFNAVTALLSGIPLHDFNCGLKIYHREVVEEIELFGERHRFTPVLAHSQGFRVGELAVEHHPRKFGRTKFGPYRFVAGFFDLITLLFRMKFLTKPLHLFGGLGLLSFLLGFGILAYLAVGWFQGKWIGNRPILMVGVLGVVTGLQLFTMGLLGEMIAEGRARNVQPPIREDSDI